jgi:lipase maturation factor 1
MVLVLGAANLPMMFVLWASYFSIVSIGQTWYSFGWESQLLEMGFLSMFLVPGLSLSLFPKNIITPWIHIWGNRWLLFRIMIGAGMIKIRGDECWRNLTCMNYHYQTQPVPNPISIYYHNSPGMNNAFESRVKVFCLKTYHLVETFHKMETMGNHIVELILPWFLLIPHRTCQWFGGLTQVLFQVISTVQINTSTLTFLINDFGEYFSYVSCSYYSILFCLVCFDFFREFIISQLVNHFTSNNVF